MLLFDDSGENCCWKEHAALWCERWTGGNLINDYFLKQNDTSDFLPSWSVTSPTGFGVLKRDTSGDVIMSVSPRRSQTARVGGSGNTCRR